MKVLCIVGVLLLSLSSSWGSEGNLDIPEVAALPTQEVLACTDAQVATRIYQLATEAGLGLELALLNVPLLAQWCGRIPAVISSEVLELCSRIAVHECGNVPYTFRHAVVFLVLAE